MRRLRRLIDLWAALPVFRVVAEQEHLPTAAKELGVSPSALSRTVRGLEVRLGAPLFDRVGRELRLNSSGKLLLASVRAALRTVDDSLDAIHGTSLSGAVRVAAPDSLTSAFVVPALCKLHREETDLVPFVSEAGPSEILERLMHGTLDLGFVSEPQSSSMVESRRFASIPRAVYCGPKHALFSARRVTVDQLAKHAFASLPATALGAPSDGWPAEIERHVGLTVASSPLVLEACASGAFLAVLPEPVVTRDRRRFRRLVPSLIAPWVIYAATRRPSSARVSHVLDAIQRELAPRARR